jgi:hypothetical protein
MRALASILTAIGLLAVAPARALIVTNGDQVVVSGPFDPSNPLAPVAILEASIQVQTNFPADFSLPTVAFWQATGSGSNGGYAGFEIFDCGQNVGGPCNHGGPPLQTTVIISDPTTIAISTSFLAAAVENGQFIDASQITGIVSIDLELVNSDSGFALAVPEPSTSIMMLIGFTAMGFAGWRITWSGQPTR